jgi:hypothetical protein
MSLRADADRKGICKIPQPNHAGLEMIANMKIIRIAA